MDIGLQTQVNGGKITTHTIMWITRRNYEAVASR